MNTESSDNTKHQQKCSRSDARKRHGSLALLFAFFIGAGSMFGLTHMGSAHAHGPFGPPGGMTNGMGEMGGMGFGGPGEFADEDKKSHWQKRFAAMREKRLTHMLDQINATDQQREQIKGALSDLKIQVEPLRAEGKTHRKTMRKLMTAEQIDATLIEQERLAMMGLADRLSRQVVAAFTEISRLLEPEQRKQLAEMMQKRSH